MSNPVTVNVEPDGALRDAADALLAAAHAYYQAYTNAGMRAAVVWISDTDGRLVILTRGEYRSHLMQNIHVLPRDHTTIRDWDNKP